ncbi:putative toxin-antitoxin system, toxin component, RelE family [Leptospira wolbachii serovar Codice str. CDC]|uniref:Toxin-antitoxin system, toxin component, RelE family n=1 Tax=Leptospira wolbachii serovar Codice str. CDC TaxID=1218599 RepID=R9A3L7_9LEPT|nr:type II toxin-antitoxin system RelE/ParE family toxin [Leptospira wolbachii]EOQ94825.1 putative toxin-antitoxin system, toxin component, RelE family [Leptospira wolbachii serovar Codice str. CDC]
MYVAKFDRNQPAKFIKKADPYIKKNIKAEIDRLIENPTIADVLVGDLIGYSSHHFKIHKTEYRIIFFLDENLKELLITYVGPRENAYDVMKNSM